MMTKEAPPDLCHGYDEIGQHMGLSARQVKHLASTGAIPTFKLGRIVCALRSKLDEALLDKAAQAAVEGGGQ
jgi:hypothetical protein